MDTGLHEVIAAVNGRWCGHDGTILIKEFVFTVGKEFLAQTLTCI